MDTFFFIKLRWALFVTYMILQSITSSEMCSLHLTHPSVHTPGAVGSWHSGVRGAVGGSVPCSRVSPQSWTEFQPEPRFEPTTSGYKSDALSIRPRLPHFIRYMGWTPFSLQKCLNSPWHRFNKVLETFLRDFFVHIDMIESNSCCRFVGCTSQRCSIGLRSGDCGGHLRKVNSLSCSRNQSEMIWALWHGALSCWK